MKNEEFEARFYAKTEHADGRLHGTFPQVCLHWIGATTNAGYGKIRYQGKLELAHRAIWMYYNGEIPQGKQILHRCDTPGCVRLSHLCLGTQKDNVDDMRAKGRHQHGLRNGRYTKPESILRGEANGMSKLTAKQVAEIRERYASENISQKRLAADYGVKQQAISKIIRGLRWGKPKMKYIV